MTRDKFKHPPFIGEVVMATTYTATMPLECWKQHTCCFCGRAYSYLFKRTCSGQGGNEDAARAAAVQNAMNLLEKSVDMQPCPDCGKYQPEMIGMHRYTRHLWWLLGSLILILPWILASCYVMPKGLAIIITVVGAAIVLLAQGFLAGAIPTTIRKPTRSRPSTPCAWALSNLLPARRRLPHLP